MAENNNGNWPNPTAISLFLVGAVIIGGFYPLQAGFVSFDALPIIGFFLIASSLVWLTLMVVCLKNGDFLGAAIHGVLGVLFGLAPGVGFVAEFIAKCYGVAVDGRINGWYLFYTGWAFFVLAWCGGKLLWHLTVTFLCVWIIAEITGLVTMGAISHHWLGVSKWLLLYAGIWFLYTGSAFTLNHVFQKKVLPLGGPLFK